MTKSRMESEAKANLLQQGYEVYLPMWVDLRRHLNDWKKVQSAMFPRYLFVKPAHAGHSISPIRSTRGVSQLVRFGKEPAWASESLIKSICQMETEQNDRGDTLKPFKPGDAVTIITGAFKGVSAEVLSSDQQRVMLMLQMLGKTQQLEFEAGICQAR